MITISRFSGKCDCYDWLSDKSDEDLSNMEIFVGDNIVPLRINNQHDLAPYYPCLVCSGDGMSVNLSERSFIDAEEEDHLSWILNEAKKYRRKCKRNKIEYDPNEFIERSSYWSGKASMREIAERVRLYGDKATIEGIHDEIHEHYRNELLEEMIRLGWDKKKAKYWIWNDWRCLMDTDGET